MLSYFLTVNSDRFCGSCHFAIIACPSTCGCTAILTVNVTASATVTGPPPVTTKRRTLQHLSLCNHCLFFYLWVYHCHCYCCCCSCWSSCYYQNLCTTAPVTMTAIIAYPPTCGCTTVVTVTTPAAVVGPPSATTKGRTQQHLPLLQLVRLLFLLLSLLLLPLVISLLLLVFLLLP